MAKARVRYRDVDGIVLLDKPVGLSSNAVLQRVRHLFRARKAGHTGSLDPFATGMLPLCFGEATKVCGFLLESAKSYRVTATLGVATATGDTEGEVIERAEVPELDATALERALARFRGEIDQVPPMHSALKHEGRRLYELARQGRTVERKARRVTVHGLQLLNFDGARLELAVHCSKGTYIRSLVQDLAAELGTVAHATALRRTAVEPFAPEAMQTPECLEEQLQSGAEPESLLLPPDAALTGLPARSLDAAEAQRICHGQRLPAEREAVAGMRRLYGPDGAFLGIGEVDATGQLRPKRLMAQAPKAGFDG